ncbi:MAG TPA: hypothetical protein VHM19_10445 [Polyangiales bacterium]|jgi:hypothetical protein|nr:hypothetical protein [Polyangiales bacterium]
MEDGHGKPLPDEPAALELRIATTRNALARDIEGFESALRKRLSLDEQIRRHPRIAAGVVFFASVLLALWLRPRRRTG